MNILIPSMAKDTDSILVKVALEMRGHIATRWIGDEFSRSQTSTFLASDTIQAESYLNMHDRSVHLENIDVVWLRRPRWPVVADAVHQDDKEHANIELRQYIRSLYEAIGDSARWVNTLHGRRRGNSKLLQLKEARNAGIRIPNTLVSNDPKEIRRFLRAELNCIVKPLIGSAFRENGKWKAPYTTSVTEDMLPDDDIIKACPCIYQKKIAKKTEVRAVFFGATVLALEIDSQQSKNGKTDWRAENSLKLGYRKIIMPPEIQMKCLAMMQRIGIVHGSFDFAITPVGEWIFFEVNEAGQFLWMEYMCEDLPVLETVTQFLADPRNDFVVKEGSNPLRVRDVQKSQEFNEIFLQDCNIFHSEETTALI